MAKLTESSLPDLSIVLGYIAIKDLEEPAEQVSILLRLGFGNKEISKICGITESTIRVIKHRSKKSSKGK